jgi:hypothetical protein
MSIREGFDKKNKACIIEGGGSSCQRHPGANQMKDNKKGVGGGVSWNS